MDPIPVTTFTPLPATRLRPVYSYLVLGLILILVIAIYLYFFLVVYSTLKKCEKEESNYCPLMYCKDPTTECGNYPWRPAPGTGTHICSKYLLTMSAPKANVKPTS
jgi:hypothetical protein